MIRDRFGDDFEMSIESGLPFALGRRLQRLEQPPGGGVLQEGAVAVVGRAAVTGNLQVAIVSLSTINF